MSEAAQSSTVGVRAATAARSGAAATAATAAVAPNAAAAPSAARAAALVRRYHRYEALAPFVCPEDPDHYLLEPFTVAGDVLLVCPTCGFADLLDPGIVPVLEERARRAAALWRGIRG